MNEREESCVELIMRGAYTHAHDIMVKLTPEEQANVENNCGWEGFDGYEQFVKGLVDVKADTVVDEIPTYDGTND